MANNVSNSLKIHCEDLVTMEKIKTMIFDEDENHKQIFTMSKMLPLPERFLGSKGYADYGYDWCRAMWGTKWDVYNYNITESNNTLTIYYATAGSPNDNWVELLCLYIQKTLCFTRREDIPPISIELRYHDYPGCFGGILEWVPFSNPETKDFSFMEYAKLHDKEMYKYVSDLEAKMKAENDAGNGI